ncbi:TPA: AAA family ATPase [Burkholderia dolosa]
MHGVAFEVGFKFPDLLLLDEPDASLHPEFSKLIVETLKETIVKKRASTCGNGASLLLDVTLERRVLPFR